MISYRAIPTCAYTNVEHKLNCYLFLEVGSSCDKQFRAELTQPVFWLHIIIIIIIIIIISFMQGIYTYIPETNYVPREYSVAAILLLQFMVLISLLAVLNLLYFYISTYWSMCAVPNMAVFCSSLTSRIPGMLLTYFLNDFVVVVVIIIIIIIIIIRLVWIK